MSEGEQDTGQGQVKAQGAPPKSPRSRPRPAAHTQLPTEHDPPSSPRSKLRANKVYRTPPTPPPEELRTKEKSFILDCSATSTISCDYSKANPKLGPVIPPYNSQKDKHVEAYFRFWGVPTLLKRTRQSNQGHSIEGPVMDAFHTRGAGFQYLSLRNQFGAGHSRELVDGHAQFMMGIKPMSGYNGRYGFRRNTPWLRKTPSPFFPNIITPTA